MLKIDVPIKFSYIEVSPYFSIFPVKCLYLSSFCPLITSVPLKLVAVHKLQCLNAALN